MSRNAPQARRPAVEESVYQNLWESSLDGCFLLRCRRDQERRIIDFEFEGANESGAAIFGLPKADLVGRSLLEVVPISRGGGLFQQYARVADTGMTLDEERELNLPEIDARWVRQQVIATPTGIAIIARDISARKQEELSNRQSKAFLQTLIDSVPLLVSARSLRPADFGEVVIWNRAAERITGYGENEVIGRTLGEELLPNVDSSVNVIDGTLHTPPPVEMSRPMIKRDGTLRRLRTIAVPVMDEYGKPEYVVGIGEDVTEHLAALEQVELASNVFEYATEAIIVSDAEDRIVTVNRAFCALTGYSEAETVGKVATEFEVAGNGSPETTRIFERLQKDGFWSGRSAQLRKDGEPFPTWLNVARVTSEAGRTLNHVRIATDITAIEQSRAQLERQATHDALTGLPNRLLFMDRLAHALERGERSTQKLALLYIDLDEFKTVNDRLGHGSGDEFLKEVANRLLHSARAVDTVCRMSGDEFTILMEESGHAGLGDPARVAERIIEALNKPFMLNGQSIKSTASIGISRHPGDGDDAHTLIRNADVAMYRAKELGRNRYEHFSETPDEKPTARMDRRSA